MLPTTAIVASLTSSHDPGLCHDYHWVRDPAAERRAYPRVANIRNVPRQEIRQSVARVRYQNMAGSDIGDGHNKCFAGPAALKAGGAHNTMNQF